MKVIFVACLMALVAVAILAPKSEDIEGVSGSGPIDRTAERALDPFCDAIKEVADVDGRWECAKGVVSLDDRTTMKITNSIVPTLSCATMENKLVTVITPDGPIHAVTQACASGPTGVSISRVPYIAPCAGPSPCKVTTCVGGICTTTEQGE